MCLRKCVTISLMLFALCTACQTESPLSGTRIEEIQFDGKGLSSFRVYVGADVWSQYPVFSKAYDERRKERLVRASEIAKEELKKIGRCPNGFVGPELILGYPNFKYSYFVVNCKK